MGCTMKIFDLILGKLELVLDKIDPKYPTHDEHGNRLGLHVVRHKIDGVWRYRNANREELARDGIFVP
jgi:hypothetical protein